MVHKHLSLFHTHTYGDLAKQNFNTINLWTALWIFTLSSLVLPHPSFINIHLSNRVFHSVSSANSIWPQPARQQPEMDGARERERKRDIEAER